jgi:PAS domain S-box-containing protein
LGQARMKDPERAAQLRLERDRLLSVIENLNIFVGMSDLQLRPFHVNSPGLRMVGLDSLDEAAKVSVLDFFFPEDQEMIGKRFLPEVLKQSRGEVEVRFRHFKTGEALWMIYNVFAMKDSRGTPLGFATISQDITRQKRVQEELQEKSFRLEKLSQELQALVDMSPLGVIAFDLDRKVRSWNSAAERILGWKAGEIIGRPLPVPESALAQWMELQRTLRLGKSFTNVESKRLRKDGTEFEAQVSGAPIRSPQGKITGFIGMIADASEVVRAREAVQRSDKLAVTGRLAATIAHEINNPLEAVMNLVYLARSGSNEDSVRELLSFAEDELRRVAHIARRTLGFYRETTEPALCQLSEVVESVLKVYEKHLQQKHVRLWREFRTRQEVMAIEGEIRQVVSNIVSNASDALAGGGLLRVRISRAPCKKGLRLTVADNGCGISESSLVHVFEPFFTTKKDVGVGLGMWVSREIVSRHGGAIRLRSSDDPARHGTAVSIYLPFQGQRARLDEVLNAPKERAA